MFIAIVTLQNLGRKHRFLFLMLLILLSGILVPSLLSGQNQAYVLPLSSGSSHLPFFNELVKDPALRNVISDAGEVASVEAQIQESQAGSARAKGARKTDLLKSTLINQLKLADYWSRSLDGLSDESPDNVNTGSLIQLRKSIIQNASNYGKNIKEPSEKSWAIYQILSQKFLLGLITRQDIAIFKQGKAISVAHRSRADLMEALLGNPKAAANFAAKLDARAQIALNLAIAQRLSGLSLHGRKIAAPSGEAMKPFLARAAGKSQRLNEAARTNTLRKLIHLTERAKLAWHPLPFSIAAFKSLPDANAIEERNAAALVKSSKYPQAMQIYVRLSKAYEGKNESAAFDLRILTLEKHQYAQTNDHRAYEKRLGMMMQKHRDNQANLEEALAKSTADTIVSFACEYEYLEEALQLINEEFGTWECVELQEKKGCGSCAAK